MRPVLGVPSICLFSNLLISSLLLSSAGQCHHTDRIAPRKLERRQKGNETPLIVTNWCPETIYPGIVTQSGDGPQNTGFELQPGDSQNQTVSEDWQGRVWGRTNCSFNSAGTAPSNNSPGKACATGDCGGIVSCKATVGDVFARLQARLLICAGRSSCNPRRVYSRWRTGSNLLRHFSRRWLQSASGNRAAATRQLILRRDPS